MRPIIILSLALSASPIWAQDLNETLNAHIADTSFILNSLLFLIGATLVMWMAAGFSMLEAGLVRSKNVSTQLMKNLMLFAIAALMYWIVGYNLMYPGDGWSIAGLLGTFAPASLEPVGVTSSEVADLSYASVGSDFIFQLMFCATTASIVSGTLAERIKLVPFLIFVAILTGFIYPIEASWKWGGGFLDTHLGFADFAGSTLVHAAGGFAALAGAIVLGPRLGRYQNDQIVPYPGSSMPLATLGTFILWMGWFGFNGASQLAMGSVGDVADISRIFANTNAAAAGGVIAAFILTSVLYGKADLTMVMNGALAGLVSITAEPLTPSLGIAALIGAIGAVLAVFAVPMLDRLKIDDVVGAIPVHLVGGIWGTLAVVLTNDEATISGQFLSILIIGAFVFITSYILWLTLRATMGIRVSEKAERDGLDSHELGINAYPEFGL